MDRPSLATHDSPRRLAEGRRSARSHVHAWRHESTAESSRLRWHPSHLVASCPPPSPSPFLQFALARPGEPVPRWHHRGGMDERVSPTSILILLAPSPVPMPAPRSSPDWMALCQPATAIALICSSSPRCPSPCAYTSVPLSSLGSYSFTVLIVCRRRAKLLRFFLNALLCTFASSQERTVRFVALCFHLGTIFFLLSSPPAPEGMLRVTSW